MELAENAGEDWEEILDQRQSEIQACIERNIPLPSWLQADRFARENIKEAESP